MLDKQVAIAIMQKAARCWAGYEPVPGAKAYSDGSCRPKGSKKTKKEVIQGKNHSEKKAADFDVEHARRVYTENPIPGLDPVKTTPSQLWNRTRGILRPDSTHTSSNAAKLMRQYYSGQMPSMPQPASSLQPRAQQPAQQPIVNRPSPCGPNGCPPRPPVSRTPMGVPKLNTPKIQPGAPQRPQMLQLAKPPQTTQTPAAFPKIAAGPLGRGPSASTLMEQARQRSLTPMRPAAPAGGQSLTARTEQARQRSLIPMRPASPVGGRSIASQAEQTRQMGLAREQPLRFPDDGATGPSPPVEFDNAPASALGQITPPPLSRASLPLQPLPETDTHVPMPPPPADLVQTPR